MTFPAYCAAIGDKWDKLPSDDDPSKTNGELIAAAEKALPDQTAREAFLRPMSSEDVATYLANL
jgi:hypothetical protein